MVINQFGRSSFIHSRTETLFSPPDRKGLLDLMLESAFAMLLHHAPTQYPARAARQWLPPSIPPELLASGSPSILPERLASGSRRVSRQSCSPADPRVSRQSGSPVDPADQSSSPVDPAEYPTRAARQWIPEYPARAARQRIPPSIPPELLTSGSPSIPPERLASGSRRPEQLVSGSRRVSHQSSPPVDPAEYPAECPRVARQRVPPSIPPE